MLVPNTANHLSAVHVYGEEVKGSNRPLATPECATKEKKERMKE